MQKMETVLLKSFDQTPIELTTTFSEMYQGNLIMKGLMLQLQLLPDLWNNQS